MTRINVLTTHTTPNSLAFNLPLISYRSELKTVGLDISLHYDVSESLYDCDTLFVNSKNFRTSGDQVLDFLSDASQKANQIFWFDTTDSTGTPQFEVLPYVDLYFKSQLLKDRSLYLKRWYGSRLFSDYYHENYGIEDESTLYSKRVESEDDLGKLRVSWCAALGYFPNSMIGKAWTRFYESTGRLLPLPIRRRWVEPSEDRPVDVSARFGAGYSRATIRYQRERVRELLAGKVDMTRLPKKEYFLEMEQSKIVVAPFGWGEYNIRDFEAFMSGSLVLKPDMNHMETWPNLYVDGRTIVSHSWDMTDLPDVIDRILDDYSSYVSIAVDAQETYRKHVDRKTAPELFVNHLQEMLEGADTPAYSRNQ